MTAGTRQPSFIALFHNSLVFFIAPGSNNTTTIIASKTSTLDSKTTAPIRDLDSALDPAAERRTNERSFDTSDIIPKKSTHQRRVRQDAARPVQVGGWRGLEVSIPHPIVLRLAANISNDTIARSARLPFHTRSAAPCAWVITSSGATDTTACSE